MSDWALSLVPQYGLVAIFITTLGSCIALPVPASLLMLSAGGFAASGELSLPSVVMAALGGAMLGDSLGYFIGRRGAGLLQHRAADLSRAHHFVQRRGAAGVFFSRWLVSPLGPYVNIVAGAGGLRFIHFALPAALGEMIWVGLYVGLGFAFSGQVGEMASLMGNASGFLAALAATLGLWFWLRHAAHRASRNSAKAP